MIEKTVSAIGIVHSPFKEKFAVPRQAKLVADIESRIELFPPYDDLNCFRGIENFSHLWLIFDFNLIEDVRTIWVCHRLSTEASNVEITKHICLLPEPIWSREHR